MNGDWSGRFGGVGQSGGVAGQKTYTIAGSSLSAYNFSPMYPVGLSVVNNGDGTATASSPLIARNLRTGQTIRMAGLSESILNQFCGKIVDHDKTSALGWIKYSLSGAFSPVATTLEVSTLHDGLFTAPYSCRGALTWLQNLAGNSLQCVGNFALAGGDTEQNLTVFDQTHAVAKPNYVIFDASTNDIFARGWSASRVITALNLFIEKIRAIGSMPVVIAIAPRNAGVTSANKITVLEVNRWLISLRNVVVINPSELILGDKSFSDPLSVDFAPSSGFLFDGVHYDRDGAYVIGRSLYEAIKKDLTPIPYLRISSATEAASLASLSTNPTLNNAGGLAPPTGFTGDNLPVGMAASKTGSVTGTVNVVDKTVIADGNGYGKKLAMTFNSTSTADQLNIVFSGFGVALSGKSYIDGFVRLKVSANSKVRAAIATLRARYVNPEDALYGSVIVSAFEAFSTSGTAIPNAMELLIPLKNLRLRKADENAGTLNRISIDVDILFGATAGASSVEIMDVCVFAR